MDAMTKIRMQLNRIEKALEEKELPMSEKQTAEFLDIDIRTLQNYAKDKLKGTYIVNRLGKRMYYPSKLIGLKDVG